MTQMDMQQVYLAYHDKVLAYIRSRINRWADAEDLCANVFEKILRNLPEFDQTKASLSTWIFTITRNTVIDYYRKAKPSEELDENLQDGSEVDDSLLTRESLSELARALQSLPSQQRDLLILRYYDGKTLTEIAAMMNLSYGAVKLRHQAALREMRRLLQDTWGDAVCQ